MSGARLSWTLLLLLSVPAQAAEDPGQRTLTEREIREFLQSDDDEPLTRDRGTESFADVPPPPPRHRGFVVESSVGAMGHIGPLKNVSPTAPWFHLQFGFEPFPWLMAFAEGDIMIANTSYAAPPPDPRTYALYGFGGGLRLSIAPFERVGLFLQGSAGLASVSEDVLTTYGYRNADSLNLYFGGELGLEWYQINPHTALALHGGVRNYSAGLSRERSTELPLVWLSGVSLRYAF